MTRESAPVKARRLLVEGRVRVLAASEDDGRLLAEVRGDSARVYTVVFEGSDGWRCDCPAVGICSHVRALQLISVLEPRGS